MTGAQNVKHSLRSRARTLVQERKVGNSEASLTKKARPTTIASVLACGFPLCPPPLLLKLTVTRLLVLRPELVPHFARACPIIVASLAHALLNAFPLRPCATLAPNGVAPFCWQHAHECHERKAWCQCFSALPAERGVFHPCPPPVIVSRAS